jgi:hypothetical protein
MRSDGDCPVLGYEASALFSRQFAISQFPFTAENFPTYLQGHRFDAETVRLLASLSTAIVTATGGLINLSSVLSSR